MFQSYRIAVKGNFRNETRPNENKVVNKREERKQHKGQD
jgi:hypothetical protein